jgi:hypothetical protein
MSDRARQRGWSLPFLEPALWGTSAILLIWLAAGRVRESRATPVRSAPAPIAAAPSAIEMIAPESLAAAVDLARDGNLFRRERQPSDPSAQVLGGAPPPMQPPQPPKPHPVLRGLLGGPPWEAVLEGLPGREGNVVMRVGESAGGLTVRAVRRDTVILQGSDTTWKLTLRRP